jgi:hypothetical protein
MKNVQHVPSWPSTGWVEGSDLSPAALSLQKDYPVPREEEVEENPEMSWTLRKGLRDFRR